MKTEPRPKYADYDDYFNRNDKTEMDFIINATGRPNLKQVREEINFELSQEENIYKFIFLGQLWHFVHFMWNFLKNIVNERRTVKNSTYFVAFVSGLYFMVCVCILVIAILIY